MTSLRSALAGALVFASAAGVSAQGLDHLSCFQIFDTAPRGTINATLSGGQPCRIKTKAMFGCVTSRDTVFSPAPAGTSPAPVSGSYLCYRARCAPPRIGNTTVTDAFGTRPVRFAAARWACLPADVSLNGGSTTTTTTLAGGSTTTSTTLVSGECRFEDGECVGTCGGTQRCGATVASGECECRDTTCGNADAPECNGACADPGKACVFNLSDCECVDIPG